LQESAYFKIVMLILHILTNFCKKKYLEKNNFQCNFAFIKSNLGFLPKSITFLEKKEIQLSDSLKTAKNKIIDLKCTKGKAVV